MTYCHEFPLMRYISLLAKAKASKLPESCIPGALLQVVDPGTGRGLTFDQFKSNAAIMAVAGEQIVAVLGQVPNGSQSLSDAP